MSWLGLFSSRFSRTRPPAFVLVPNPDGIRPHGTAGITDRISGAPTAGPLTSVPLAKPRSTILAFDSIVVDFGSHAVARDKKPASRQLVIRSVNHEPRDGNEMPSEYGLAFPACKSQSTDPSSPLKLIKLLLYWIRKTTHHRQQQLVCSEGQQI